MGAQLHEVSFKSEPSYSGCMAWAGGGVSVLEISPNRTQLMTGSIDGQLDVGRINGLSLNEIAGAPPPPPPPNPTRSHLRLHLALAFFQLTRMLHNLGCMTGLNEALLRIGSTDAYLGAPEWCWRPLEVLAQICEWPVSSITLLEACPMPNGIVQSAQ